MFLHPEDFYLSMQNSISVTKEVQDLFNCLKSGKFDIAEFGKAATKLQSSIEAAEAESKGEKKKKKSGETLAYKLKYENLFG